MINLKNIFIKDKKVYKLEGENKIKNIEKNTIIITYISNENTQKQSIFSVSDSEKEAYFHIYIQNGGEIGISFKNNEKNIEYCANMPSVLRGKYKGENAENTICILINNEKKIYYIFVNGKKIFTINNENFQKMSDICDMKNVVIGGLLIDNCIKNQFIGKIKSVKIYEKLLDKNEIIKNTKNEKYNKEIFYAGDETNANYFRIPALYTLKSGTVVSTIDARYGGTHDSKSKINIGFSKSLDNGKSWSKKTMPMQFLDYKNQAIDWHREIGKRDMQIGGSASFIDSVLLENEQKRLFLFADAMPFGIGSPNSKKGSGYKNINGKNYIKLYFAEDKENEYNYSIRENGEIYNDIKNEKTCYKIDGEYNLLKNNEYLLQKQYFVKFDENNLLEEKTNIDVKTNIFYKDCIFKIYPTNYLAMKYSDDEGENWSDMEIMDINIDEDDETPIFAPTRAIQIKNGKYKGRIILNAYLTKSAKFGNIISDDDGKTWRYKIIELPETVFTEAQTVELTDGTLITYSRTNKGKIGFIISKDGGDTFGDVDFIENINLPSYGTQISAIKYSKLIDGKEAILLSTPTSNEGRKAGKIYIGLVGEDTKIDWKYEYSIDFQDYGYSYSCLTELKNGDIGIFYEKYDSWAREEIHLKDVLKFEIYTIEELKNIV